MTTYYARVEYEYTSGDRIFTIPFSYIKEEHINVFINDVETTNFVFNSTSQIQINDTLTAGDMIVIARNTPIDERLVVFTNTSILSKENQNLSADQTFDAVQEIYDNNIVFKQNFDAAFEDYKETIDGEIDALDDRVTAATNTANTALETSNTALETAYSADSTAETALSNSQTAITTANTASQTATQAEQEATEAVTTAGNAETIAERAEDKVDEFGEDIEVVKEAAEKINELEEAVQTAVTKAGEATAAAQSASSDASIATTAAQTATTQAEEAKAKVGNLADLTTAAKSTVVAAINEVNNKPSALANLTDVSLTSLTDKQLLSYNTTTQKWENTNASASKYLLEHFWSDHLIDNMAVLRADTFSWQSGTTYSNAYNHLVDDIEDKTLTSEAVAGITIQYYLADDGHKICPASQENNVLSLYNTTGIAWYYILDTENQRFKLPRTKYGFVGYRDDVGKYVPESLPNVKSWIVNNITTSGGGDDAALYAIEDGPSHKNPNWQTSTNNVALHLDLSRSSSTYQDNAPVQQCSTQMYLYFYVGEYSQTAIEQTAGITAEQLNAKQDVCTHIIETYVNGTSGYRIWSDGYCEQWGAHTFMVNNSNTAINLLKTFNSVNYSLLAQGSVVDTGNTNTVYAVDSTTNSFTLGMYSKAQKVYWKASGYLAQGEY